MVPAVDDLLQPKLSEKQQTEARERLRQAMQVETIRAVNALLKRYEITVPPCLKQVLRKKIHENRVHRTTLKQRHTLSYIAGSTTAEDAALNAEVSYRQIYRCAEQLLKPLQLKPADLKPLSNHQRRLIADEAERILLEEAVAA